jgi:glycosyltransferase involved in cell wall biosynthesis
MVSMSRLKIALIYAYNENWIGGTYYIQNIIHALNCLRDEQKPALEIFTKTTVEFDQLSAVTAYPYLTFRLLDREPGLLVTYFTLIIRKIFRNQYVCKKMNTDADIVFPARLGMVNLKKSTPVYWIPDFQEHYLPDFFTPHEVMNRKNWQLNISKTKQYLVLSSMDALNTFEDLYPHSTVKRFVLNFAVTLPSTGDIDEQALIKKYQIAGPFFICPNQFWIHKNHIVVLEAVAILKQRGTDITMVFTGKESDYRSPDYSDQLRKRIVESGIEDNCRMLGFIDRKELIKVIEMSVAVIQPSKFEGWSTSVEDAKAVNKFVIASGINVHREQLQNNASFFDSDSPTQLADAIERIIKMPVKITGNHYANMVKAFGENFIGIMNTVMNK